MEEEQQGKRLAKRKKRLERRRLERERAVQARESKVRIDLFLKIGIFCLLGLIVVDVFIKMYPIFSSTIMSFDSATLFYYLKQGLGIGFGFALYYAGKRVKRDTGIYGAAFQIDGSVLGILNLSIFLIANPFRYTQEDLVVNSIYFGIETISSISFLIFGILVAFFFILVGSNSQQQPLRWIVMITGILWLVVLFLPVLTPSATSDPVVYSITSAVTWVTYGLTAFVFWKMIYEFDGFLPTTPSNYQIK
ncbi:MAG: hypothetical protein ACTSQ8_00280 [Candidatus Helarchaeota archaeon]